jgi:hypothetical protein
MFQSFALFYCFYSATMKIGTLGFKKDGNQIYKVQCFLIKTLAVRMIEWLGSKKLQRGI